MIAVVGLGNPGSRYESTRHNAGFSFLDRIADRYDIPISRSGFDALYGVGVVSGERVILAKPQTFMNRSGESVLPLLNYYKLKVSSLVVVHDEIDLPLGKIKLKKGGGDAGHNGLSSITGLVGSPDYYRFRFGVGRPEKGESVSQYVLSSFAGDGLSLVEESLGHLEELFEKLLHEISGCGGVV